MATFKGTATRIEVDDDDKKARVTLDDGSGTERVFEITRDTDTGFNAMVTVLAIASGFWDQVTVEHNPGDNKIDKVIY